MSFDLCSHIYIDLSLNLRVERAGTNRLLLSKEKENKRFTLTGVTRVFSPVSAVVEVPTRAEGLQVDFIFSSFNIKLLGTVFPREYGVPSSQIEAVGTVLRRTFCV